MSKLAGNAGSSTGVIIAAGAAVLAAVGAGIYFGTQGAPEPTEIAQPSVVETPATQGAEPSTDLVPTDTTAETSDDTDTTEPVRKDTAQAPQAVPPSIDEVRVEADGLTIVAGRAKPGSRVSIQLDGDENMSVDVDATGSFAAITLIEPSDDARVLSLMQTFEEEILASLDEVILAPVVAATTEDSSIETAEVTPEARADAAAGVASDDTASVAVDDAGNVAVDDVVDVAVDDAPDVSVDDVAGVPVDDVAVVADAGPVEGGEATGTQESGATDVETVEVAQTNTTAAAVDEAPDKSDPVQPAETLTATSEADTATQPEETELSDASPQIQTDLALLSDPAGGTPNVVEPPVSSDRQPGDALQGSALGADGTGRDDLNVDTTEAEPLPELPVDATTEVTAVATPQQAPLASPAGPTAEPVDGVQSAQTLAQTEGTPQDEPARRAAADPPQKIAILRSTEDGVEVLGRQAVLVESVALDTISYSDEGAVRLAGRAKLDSEAVRIYLNNRAIATLPVDEDGRWRGDLPDVDTGVYILRVDEVTAEGNVSSRIETPFKREDPAILARARGGDFKRAKRVTVQKGDTLWAISRDRYGDGVLYVQVFEANRANIRNPDLIFPGQVFDLPEGTATDAN